ncbi:MAG: DUF4126 domain-containing protein, partial [Steroidobacteraceae bacterium]|nr:DUF4126 domain-containing protein [Steroidobacteraceae bacterium]
SFQWLGTLPAVVTLGVAASVEIAAYYLPGIDHLLDAVAMPITLLAGTVTAAAVMTELPPIVKWATAMIAGGGAAGLMHGASAALRAKSTVATGGIGNSAIASGEWSGALLLSLLALAAPLFALAIVLLAIALLVALVRRMLRRRRGHPASG